MRARPHPRKYVQKLALRAPQEPGEPGIQLRPYQIVLRPLVSEKTMHLSTQSTRSKTDAEGRTKKRGDAYTFVVNPLATKPMIAAAIHELFNVRVDKVRVQNRKGKKTVFRGQPGQHADWKKAIVTLHPDDKIDIV